LRAHLAGSIPLFLIAPDARSEARNSIRRVDASISLEPATMAAEMSARTDLGRYGAREIDAGHGHNLTDGHDGNVRLSRGNHGGGIRAARQGGHARTAKLETRGS
jgi:hypothetical protein